MTIAFTSSFLPLNLPPYTNRFEISTLISFGNGLTQALRPACNCIVLTLALKKSLSESVLVEIMPKNKPLHFIIIANLTIQNDEFEGK
jgi:hypothetical protein